MAERCFGLEALTDVDDAAPGRGGPGTDAGVVLYASALVDRQPCSVAPRNAEKANFCEQVVHGSERKVQ